jgi:integrase/recombinase XerD
MLDILFAKARTRDRVRQPWLTACINAFLSGLAAQKFKQPTLCSHAQVLLDFGEFAEKQGCQVPEELPVWVEPFVVQLPTERQVRWRGVLTRFVRFTLPGQVFPLNQTADTADSQGRLVAEYASFLGEHQGLCAKTISTIQRTCLALLTFHADGGGANLTTLKPEVIHRFLIAAGKRYARSSMRSICWVIRRFLAHLHRRQVIAIDLSRAVVSPRVYTHEHCPRFLTRAEIESVLAVIDRLTPLGKRDYAMLLLLAVYGLRGIEVRRLRLDDIDWRNETLRIVNRKAGNTTTYPLAAAVGDAILSYLKDGRPASTHREVFLTVTAPITPLASTDSQGNQLRKYMAQAGVTVERPRTHLFRYSCASRLFEQGLDLKTIGDYLGHAHPKSTQGYTKIALDQLREVALGDAEDLL